MKSTMRSFPLIEYQRAGCQQFKESPVIWTALHQETQGKICDTGCAMYDEGRCPAYRNLNTYGKRSDLSKTEKLKQETIREEAARTGMKINEVRRLRNSG